MNPRGYAQRYDRKSMDRIMLIYMEFGSLPSTFRMRERERERELNLLKTHTRRPMKLNEKNPNFKYRLRERERERERQEKSGLGDCDEQKIKHGVVNIRVRMNLFPPLQVDYSSRLMWKPQKAVATRRLSRTGAC